MGGFVSGEISAEGGMGNSRGISTVGAQEIKKKVEVLRFRSFSCRDQMVAQCREKRLTARLQWARKGRDE